jgi:hypothetical protein
VKAHSFLLDQRCPKVPPEVAALDSDNTLVVAFGAPDLEKAKPHLDELVLQFPRSHVIGCSTAGEIHGTQIHDGAVSVAVARFEDTQLMSASVEVPSAEDSFSSGEALIEKLARPDLRAVFVLSEGLHVNGSRLIGGMNRRAADGVVITGGLAGDGSRFGKTWVLSSGHIRDKTVAAIGFYGSRFVVGHGSKGGWDQFGLHRVVTRAEKNVLYELNGKPALAVYKDYLGTLSNGLPATALLFPLAIHQAKDDEEPIVRTVLSIDEAKQSLTFAGDIPEGARVQLMRADFDRLIEGASEAAKLTRAIECEDGDSLSIAISCVGRRLVLGERAEEEVESALDALPKGTKLVGFYSYGELSPLATGTCELHNQTMTLTMFREQAAA